MCFFSGLKKQQQEDDVDDQYSALQRQTTMNSKQFPSPEQREFLLRCCLPRPAPYSASVPQRMYACLLPNDFRLAGAFSQDTTFQ